MLLVPFFSACVVVIVVVVDVIFVGYLFMSKGFPYKDQIAVLFIVLIY